MLRYWRCNHHTVVANSISARYCDLVVSVNFTVSPFLYWVDVHTAQRSRQCLSSIQQTQLSKMKFCEDWRGAFPTSPAEVCCITPELCFRMHDIDLSAWDNYLIGIGIFRNLKKIVSWLYKNLKIFHWMLPLKGSPNPPQPHWGPCLQKVNICGNTFMQYQLKSFVLVKG